MNTTAQILTDLSSIKSELESSVTDLDSAINEASTHLLALQQELASIAGNRGRYEQDLSNWTVIVQSLEQDQAKAETDVTLAKGTSVQAQKERELNQIEEQLTKAQNELSLLEASHQADTKAETDTLAAIAHTQQQLAALQAQRQKASATLARFDKDLYKHTREIGLYELQLADDSVSSAQASLDQARAHREQVQRELAKSLSPWTALAEQTLIEHGIFAQSAEEKLLEATLSKVELLVASWPQLGHDAIALAFAKVPIEAIRDYNGLQAYKASQDRIRAQGGVVVANPIMMKFELQMQQLEQLLSNRRAHNQQQRASELLNQVQQTPE